VTVTSVTPPQALLAAIVNGTPKQRMAAWPDAYVEYRSKMFGAAFKKTRNEHDAHDAVQQAFSEVMTSDPAKLANVKSLGAYLARAASNRAVDIVRKNEQSDATDPDDLVHLADGDADVAEDVINETALEHGLAILDEMPEGVRYAYEQRVLLGRRATDVAADRGYKPQYVPQLVKKAVTIIDERSAFIDRGTIDLTSPATSPEETKDAS
jgi:DNA-directed RNA polymerase specialized sigma24 family protein